MSWSVAPLTLGHHDVIMITSSLQHSLLTVGGEFEGDRCFCLCEGTASAPGDLRQAEMGEFVPSTGEERGRAAWTVGREAARSWRREKGRRREIGEGEGGREEWREFDNAVPNKP